MLLDIVRSEIAARTIASKHELEDKMTKLKSKQAAADAAHRAYLSKVAALKAERDALDAKTQRAERVKVVNRIKKTNTCLREKAALIERQRVVLEGLEHNYRRFFVKNF